MLAAVLPTVGVSFDFCQAEEFRRGQALHPARASAADYGEMVRFLPPKEAELDEISFSAKEPKLARDAAANLPALAAIADPLGKRDGLRAPRCWEREAEVAALEERLREGRASLCLIGEPGCGKTSALAEAARSSAPPDLIAPPAFWLTSRRIIAGCALGKCRERLEQAIDELSQIGAVLCVENLLELARLGGVRSGGSIAASNPVSRGELRLVEGDACRDRRLQARPAGLRRLTPAGPVQAARARRAFASCGAPPRSSTPPVPSAYRPPPRFIGDLFDASALRRLSRRAGRFFWARRPSAARRERRDARLRRRQFRRQHRIARGVPARRQTSPRWWTGLNPKCSGRATPSRPPRARWQNSAPG
ncbi:MAG: hypothetical protein R3F11_24745 [Verrucomicrobiales bacterium]